MSAKWELESGVVETYGAVRSIHAFGPDAVRLVAAAQALAVLDAAILEWWGEHEYDTDTAIVGGESVDYPRYDAPPPFVALAMERGGR